MLQVAFCDQNTEYMFGALSVGAVATLSSMGMNNQMHQLMAGIVGAHPIASLDMATNTIKGMRKDLQYAGSASGQPDQAAVLGRTIAPWIEWLEGAAQATYTEMPLEGRVAIWKDIFAVAMGRTGLRKQIGDLLLSPQYIASALQNSQTPPGSQREREPALPAARSPRRRPKRLPSLPRKAALMALMMRTTMTFMTVQTKSSMRALLWQLPQGRQSHCVWPQTPSLALKAPCR